MCTKLNHYNKLTTITILSCKKNDSKICSSNNLQKSFFLHLHPWSMGRKSNPWQIKKDIQIYGHRLFCSNPIWCSFTLCVDTVDRVMAEGSADFPALPKWLAAADADLYSSSSDIIPFSKYWYSEPCSTVSSWLKISGSKSGIIIFEYLHLQLLW